MIGRRKYRVDAGVGDSTPDGKHLIGWSERVSLPEWGIVDLRAKVDTGARTSALHVENFTQLSDGWVRFDVILNRKQKKKVEVTARVLKWAKVRSSSGEYSTRCFVRTQVQVGPLSKEIDISLVSRERMLFRMLLGRKALEKDFLVDVTRRGVFASNKGQKRQTKKKKKKAL